VSESEPLWRRPIEVELYETLESEKPAWTLTFRQPTINEAVSAQELSEQQSKMGAAAFAQACLELARPLFLSGPEGFFDSVASLHAAGVIWEAVFFRTGFTLANGAPGLRRLATRLEGSIGQPDGSGKAGRGSGPQVQGLQHDLPGKELPTEVSGADVPGMQEARRPSTGDDSDSPVEGLS
jgi:hypothetical protein